MKIPFVLENIDYYDTDCDIMVRGRMRGLCSLLSNTYFLVDAAELHKNTIKKVIFNGPATIVFWNDGTKTVVKCCGEAFDPEKGLAMAIAKKALGNEGNYYNVFRKFLPKKEESELTNPIRDAFNENMRLLREALLRL